MKKTPKTQAKRLVFFALSFFLLFSLCLTSCSDDDDDDDEDYSSSTLTLSAVTSFKVALSDDIPNTIVLSWYDSAYYSAYYWIYKNTVEDSSTAQEITRDLTASSSTVSYSMELEKSGTYYFWVKRALGTSSDSNASDFSKTASIEFTYREDPDLASPTNVQAVATEESADVVISWDAVEGASYYWVYYNTTGDSSGATQLASDVTDTSYTATVSYDGNYYFWVKAADGTTASSFTSDFSDITGCYVAFSSNLDAPSDVTAQTTSTLNEVKISWTKVSSVTYYALYYNTTDDPSTSTLLEKNIYSYSSTTATETITLTESGTYYFWLKSQSKYWSSSATAVNTSDFSEPASLEFEYTTLEAPEDVTVTRPYTNALKISWDDSDAAYYWVYYGTSDDEDSAVLLEKTTSAYTTLALDEEDSGTTYYFWVKAANGSSSSSMKSAFSDIAYYKFTYKELSAPEDLSISKAYSSTYKLSWSTDAYVSRVYQGTEDDSSSAERVSSTYLNYTYITLSDSGTYYFWVKSANSSSDDSSTSDFSDSVSITIE